MITLADLAQAREYGLKAHAAWKAQIRLNTSVLNDEWEVFWPDQTVERSSPLVENIYAGSLEDKVNAAAAFLPDTIVPPTQGTRNDQAESNAERRRRVFMSYRVRSRLNREWPHYLMNLLHAGAVYAAPWTNWTHPDGTPIPPAGRFPYWLRFDPAQAYPLAHNSQGDLTQIFFARQRRLRSLEHEYGRAHPALTSIRNSRSNRGLDEGRWLEELWYYDEDTWAVAFLDTMVASRYQGVEMQDDSHLLAATSPRLEWVSEPDKHRLLRCPVIEGRRTTIGKYRGGLEDIIPQLKVANNFMNRVLDDLDDNIYGPVVLDNIENREEYGPGAVLYGNGDGTANIIRDRAPVNFEANNIIAGLLEQARRQAMTPQQRHGDPGASITSAKGITASMGSFNDELGSMQRILEGFLTDLQSVTANFDEVHCPGRKKISGFDAGKGFVESYDPVSLWKGDYRNEVSYGDKSGLDAQQHLVRTATIHQLGGMSRRSFMTRTGMVEDVLAEERDVAIEKLMDLFLDGILPQTIASGDLNALRLFVEKIDSDKMTVREAISATINEMLEPAPAGGPAGEGGPAGNTDIMRLVRSLGAGGIPGRAEGQPGAGPPGRAMLQTAPPDARRRLASAQPGPSGP